MPVAGMVMLAVGDKALWHETGHPLPADSNIHFAALGEIDADFLSRLRPDIVVAPLVSTTFDCVDLAARLTQASYTGRLRVLTSYLPNPNMVRREINALFPDLDFDIILSKGGHGSGLS